MAATYGALKADVESAVVRGTIPAFVYSLTTADLNRELRLLEMAENVSLTLTGEVTALPADFLEVSSVYLDADPRRAMRPATDMALSSDYDPSGLPHYYAVAPTGLRVMPAPDNDYDVDLTYYARLADFVDDSDTNAVLTTYPGLYHYGACYHASVWAQDDGLQATYGGAYLAEIDRARKTDVKRRLGGGPLTSRSGVRGF